METATAELPDLQPEEQYFSPELLIARHQASLRRAAAMVADHDMILGFRFQPLTPASYSRLLLLESPFLWQQPAESADVRDYLWNHWPAFSLEGTGRESFLRAFEQRMAPSWLRWRYSRPAWTERLAMAYAQTAEKISELMRMAFADDPGNGTKSQGGKIVCATLEAQMIDLFAEKYRWEPERTRRTPLRQLYQFIRCSDRSDYAPEDAAIIAADLAAANAPAIAAAKQKAS